MSHNPWWRGAVIYQIYPRSYLDASGDGVGDLPGIIERLDHIAALGADAIWISPFFKSPMADLGSHIADYRDADPPFGSLVVFDRLLPKAHGLGLTVVIRQVLSPTSPAPAWFRDSRHCPTNPHAPTQHTNNTTPTSITKKKTQHTTTYKKKINKQKILTTKTTKYNCF